VPVEADLGFAADLVDEGTDPGLSVAEDHRAGGVDNVDALGARVDHDPRLAGEPGWSKAMCEHEKPDRFHAEVARGAEVLDRHVGLRAVRGDPRHRRARVPRFLQVLNRAHTGEQQHGNPRSGGFVDSGGDEVDLLGT